MTLYVLDSIEEINYLKNSESTLQKIEKIKTTLLEMNCTSKISAPIRVQDNKMELDFKISFSVD